MTFWNMFRPVLSPGKASPVAKMGFVLATAFAVGSVTVKAFNPNPIPSKRIGRREEFSPSSNTLHRHWIPSPFSPTTVHCEPQPNGLGSAVGVNGDNLKEASVISQELNSSARYQRMNPPSRMDLHTHALGQLLRPDRIERYEIYKKLDSSTVFRKAEDARDIHVVTALVDFGHSLDGHPKVVHGGILALVLDDIFGFSFEAIGVPMAVTANLTLDYRAPTPAGESVMIQVYLERRENRKLFFKGEVTSLDGSVVYAESSCLYIIPRAVWEGMGSQEDKK